MLNITKSLDPVLITAAAGLAFLIGSATAEGAPPKRNCDAFGNCDRLGGLPTSPPGAVEAGRYCCQEWSTRKTADGKVVQDGKNCMKSDDANGCVRGAVLENGVRGHSKQCEGETLSPAGATAVVTDCTVK